MKTIQQLETENLSFSIGAALTDGWAYVSKNLLFYILGAIITFIISMACGFIPFIGSIANSLILSPCLIAGAVYVTWQISNGHAWTDFGDMFKGFSYLTQLMVAALIQGAIVLAIAMIFLISYIPEIIQLIKLGTGSGMMSNQNEIKDLLLNLLSTKTVVLILSVCVFALFISIIWSFKTHFIVIYKMEAWKAMEASRKIALKNFFALLGLFIILGLIVLVSALPCGLGLLFTMPWMIGSTYSAFAQITGCDNAYDIQKEGFDFLKAENTVSE